jgi:hypothetical protein
MTRAHHQRFRDPARGAGTLTHPWKRVPSTCQRWSSARPKHEPVAGGHRGRWQRGAHAARAVIQEASSPPITQGIPMSNRKPSMLIFGAPAAIRPSGMPAGMAGSSRTFVGDVGTGSTEVSLEAVAANLRTVVDQVEELVSRGEGSAGKLGVAHVDVNLVICADGSVSLLGTAAGTSAKPTLTLRLAPRVGSKPSGQGSAEARIFAMDDKRVVLEQAAIG